MILDNYSNQIVLLCKSHKVKSLFAFGSVLTEKFNERSDIDFVVDIDTNDPIDYAENYFDLKFNLEKLLNKNVDLLESKAINNPYLKKAIESSKQLVYAGSKSL